MVQCCRNILSLKRLLLATDLHQLPLQCRAVPVEEHQLVVAGAAHGLPLIARVHALNQHLNQGQDVFC